jgi:hypothetical protein
MNQPSYRTQLEVAVVWLEALIRCEEKGEAYYQEFFEENPVVFRVLGYRNFYAFTKEQGRELPRDEHTNLKPEPDFIVERDDGLFEIFEIKTPFSKNLTLDSNRYREKFTAEVNSYISQGITYENYFTRNPANRQRVKKLHGLDIQEDLDIKLVMGLNEHIDKARVHQQLRRLAYKVDILTYDDIVNRLEKEHDLQYGEYEGLRGFSFHFVVRFRDVPEARRKYFFDIGRDADKNRISVYLDERNDVCFDVIDRTGKVYRVELDSSELQILDEWAYFFRFAHF